MGEPSRDRHSGVCRPLDRGDISPGWVGDAGALLEEDGTREVSSHRETAGDFAAWAAPAHTWPSPTPQRRRAPRRPRRQPGTGEAAARPAAPRGPRLEHLLLETRLRLPPQSAAPWDGTLHEDRSARGARSTRPVTPADQHCCLPRQRPRPAPGRWGRLLRAPPGEHTRHVDTQTLWPPGTRGVGADPEADAGAPQTQPGVPPRAVPATGSPRGCGHSLRLHGPLGGPGPLAPPGPRGLAHGSLVCLGTLPAGPCAQAGDPPELVRVGDVSRVGLSPVTRTQRTRRAEEGGGRGDVASERAGNAPGAGRGLAQTPRSRGGSPWPTPGPGLAPPQLYKDKFLLLKLPSVARGRGSPGKLAGLMNVLSMFPLTHTPPWTT